MAQRAGRLLLSFFRSAYGVDEQQTNAAGKVPWRRGSSRATALPKGDKGRCRRGNNRLFLRTVRFMKTTLFHDFPFQYARFFVRLLQRSNKIEINKHQKDTHATVQKRRKLCIISTDRKTERSVSYEKEFWLRAAQATLAATPAFLFLKRATM